MRLAPRVLLLVGLSLGAALAAATPTQVHGLDRIACQLTAPLVPATGCDPWDPEEPVMLPPGERHYVEFTVTWTATSASAERLQVEILGNPSCQEHEAQGCMRAVAVGTSPLTVRLEGHGATGSRAYGGVLVAPVCTRDGCDTVPFRIVRDQPFSFTWTYE